MHPGNRPLSSNLDFASGEFTEDTRQQVRSCSTLPPRTTKRDLRQALDNAVDLVKSALPACWVVAESEAQRVNNLEYLSLVPLVPNRLFPLFT